MKFEDNMKKLLEGVKSFITADNTESVTNLCEIVKEMESEHNALKEENTKLKDKIVDVVSGTMFREQPQTEVVEKEKSFDDLLLEALTKATQ